MRANWKVTAAQRIVSSLSPARLAGWRALEDRPIAGRGVDIASGQVTFQETDVTLPGPPEMPLSRTYASGWAHRVGALGRGWSLSLEQHIAVEAGGLVYRDGEGRELLFEHDGAPSPGMRLHHPLDRVQLACVAPGELRVLDRTGARLSFGMTGDGRVARLRSLQRGARTAFVRHDGDGMPVELSVGALRLTLSYQYQRLVLVRLIFTDDTAMELGRYEYDSSGDLARVRLPHDVDLRYEYASGLMVARGRVGGDTTYYGYDDTSSRAKCVRTWSHSGYDDRSLSYRRGATTVVDATGATHVFAHDALYRPTDTPLGTITYDPDRLVPTRWVGHGGRVEVTVGPDGRPQVLTARDGSVQRFAYDELGRVVAFRDRTGAETTLRYGAGELPLERAGDGPRTFVRENEEGKTEIVVGDEWLVVERDGGDRPVRVSLRNEVWTARYDELGRPEVLRGPDGDRRFEHDAYGRLTAVESNGGRAAFRWDGEGRLTHARLPSGDWVIERDGGGMPRLVTRPEFAYELLYDRERRLTEVRDRRGRRWVFERDRAGRVVSEVDFDGRAHEYRYLGASRHVGTVIQPDGSRLTALRDPHGRVIEASYGDAIDERFEYDVAGRLIAATRSVSVSSPGRTVRLSRNRRGDVLTERQGDDEVGANHDARGRRALLVSSLGARITRQWGPHGERRLEIIAPDGEVHEVRLDRRRLGTGRLLIERAPDRPPVRVVGEGTVSRDDTGRIVEWVAPDGRAYRYGYGPDGLIERIELPGGDTLTYTYDPFGRRVAGETSSWQARWVWDGGVVLHELSSYAAPTLFVFDPADGSPIGKVQPGAARWLGLYRDFVALFDPNDPEQPTTEYWPWRGGLSIDFLTGLWLGPNRAFHPRAAEPMGVSALVDGLFGPAERRPFSYEPRVTTLLDRASDGTIADFLDRLTRPEWLSIETTPAAPWPEPIPPPRLIPASLGV